LAHTALYRKYRSQTFDDLVGQDHVIRTLKHAIEQGRIGHAYLFTGPRGTGKTSTARLLAKALNCTNGPSANPAEDDPICQEIAAGNCMDVVELDAASESGIDDVRRAVVEASEYKPSYCRYRVFIIDEVHDLSRNAFDALLKTIEEPPGHVVFILATTEFHKVPPTIRSRCQRFDFHRGSVESLTQRLEHVAKAEGAEYEPAALVAIARMADGGYRDALTLLEQAIVTAEGPITLDQVYNQLGLIPDEAVDGLVEAIVRTDIGAIQERVGEFYRRGRDPRTILESILYRLADLTRSLYGVQDGAGLAPTEEAARHARAKEWGADAILAIRGAVAQAMKGIQDVTIPRLWLEAELARIAMGFQRRPAPVAAAVVARVAASPEPAPIPAAKTSSPPTKRVPAAVGDVWAAVVEEWSQKSPKAKSWLQGTYVRESDEERWTIVFPLQFSLERLRESKNAIAKLQESVNERVGGKVRLELIAESTAAVPKDVEIPVSTVESDLTGEPLYEETKRILGQE